MVRRATYTLRYHEKDRTTVRRTTKLLAKHCCSQRSDRAFVYSRSEKDLLWGRQFAELAAAQNWWHDAATLVRVTFAAGLDVKTFHVQTESKLFVWIRGAQSSSENSKTCSTSCIVGTCLLQHRCFLCIASCCTAPSVSTVQSAWTLTSWGSSRSQEYRHHGSSSASSFTPAGCKNFLLDVPNNRPASQSKSSFPSPLSNCLVCRCIGETAIGRRWQPLQARPRDVRNGVPARQAGFLDPGIPKALGGQRPRNTLGVSSGSTTWSSWQVRGTRSHSPFSAISPTSRGTLRG